VTENLLLQEAESHANDHVRETTTICGNGLAHTTTPTGENGLALVTMIQEDNHSWKEDDLWNDTPSTLQDRNVPDLVMMIAEGNGLDLVMITRALMSGWMIRVAKWQSQLGLMTISGAMTNSSTKCHQNLVKKLMEASSIDQAFID